MTEPLSTEQTAADLKLETEATAADLAATVIETASALKIQTEKTAAVVKDAADINSQFAPILLKALEVLSKAVDELSKNSVDLKNQSREEVEILRGRTKYFTALIVIGILMVLGVLYNAVQISELT